MINLMLNDDQGCLMKGLIIGSKFRIFVFMLIGMNNLTKNNVISHSRVLPNVTQFFKLLLNLICDLFNFDLLMVLKVTSYLG
jgi:hypothetical protein